MREPQTDRCVRLRIEDVPALRLSARESAGAGLLVIGMNLDRQVLAGEQIFGQQWLFASAGERDFADPLASWGREYSGQRCPTPGFRYVPTLKLNQGRV